MPRGSELARRGTGASMRPAHGAPVASEGPSGLLQEWVPAALEPRFSVPDSMDRPLPTPTNARVFVKILTPVVQSNTFQSLRLRPFVNRLSRDSEQLCDLAVRAGFANSIITALQAVTLLNSLHTHRLRRISNPLIIRSGAAPDDLAPPDPGGTQSHRLIDEASKRGVVARPRRASPSSPDSTRLVRLEVLTSSLSMLHLPCWGGTAVSFIASDALFCFPA